METRVPSVFGVAFAIVAREDDGPYSRRTRTDALSRSHGAQTPFWARTLDVPLFPKRVDWAHHVSVVGQDPRNQEHCLHAGATRSCHPWSCGFRGMTVRRMKE